MRFEEKFEKWVSSRSTIASKIMDGIEVTLVRIACALIMIRISDMAR